MADFIYFFLTVAFEDELALQQKLSMQQAVLEELNHQNQTSSYTQRVAESAIVNSAVALHSETNSQTTNSNEKEASPCVSNSTNDWDACADAWASSSSKTPRNEVKSITNVDQSSWGATCKLPASSNSKTPSDDWDSWSTTSNSTAPGSNIVPISGGNDDWSTSADASEVSQETNAGSNQSDGWRSTETVKSSRTSGYNASRGGGVSERKPLRHCFEVIILSYNGE